MGDENAGPEFDDDALRELRQDMGEAMGEFVRSFRQGMEETQATMTDALAAGRLSVVGDAAHKLKGTAGYIGAVALVATLQRIQHDCREGQPREVIEPLLDRAKRLCERVDERLAPLSQD